MKYNKYGNKKVEIDGIKFDSRKEANRYAELKLLERCRDITDLELQPRFLLQDKFKHNGKAIRKVEYVADFMYKRDGEIYVEDVKGMKTDVYSLKKKLFLKKYSEYIFKEI
ncbi:DUF1064 domain-containing protein [Peptostreptococcus faecalis]|uniref:DUF1064 domain-containing protein n=1 Tax=Peptostreptococcus faecalis TaxID=2045015 RepID=UPI000C7A2C17|nr:DUF1064 domain-containing protein [Peptostreptococcus faecalis]